MASEVTEFRFDRPCVQCGGVVRYTNEPKTCVACIRAYRRLPRVKERRNELQTAKRRTDVRYQMAASARRSSVLYGRACTITADDIVIPELCPLLEIPIFINGGKVSDNSPTLDRFDSKIGYLPSNIWVISHRANRIKNNATLREAELLVRNWREYQSRR